MFKKIFENFRSFIKHDLVDNFIKTNKKDQQNFKIQQAILEKNCKIKIRVSLLIMIG